MKKDLQLFLRWLPALLAVFAGLAAAPPPTPTPSLLPPQGVQPLDSAYGVQLFRKDYPNGSPDYVQVIDLSKGAALRLLHAPLSDPRPEKGVYGGADPRFVSQPLQSFWQQASAESERLFCVTNGSFFYMPEHPTRLAFPLKVNGKIITDGWGIDTYIGQKQMLELWEDHANIRPLTGQALYASTAPDIIGGLTEQANKRAKFAVARTFVGLDDRDKDGSYETVLLLNTLTALQSAAAGALREYGADRVMMLDGGGSTQLLCKSGALIQSERLIPQAIAVIAGAPPPVSTRIVQRPAWPVGVAGKEASLRVEVRNTGYVSWTPEDTTIELESGRMGLRQILPLEKRVRPGETLVFTATLPAFHEPGIYPLQLGWDVSHAGKLYAGEAITATALILPADLAGQRQDVQRQVDAWALQDPARVAEQAQAWIENEARAKTPPPRPQPSQPAGELRLADVLYVPLIILPLALLFLLFLSRNRDRDKN